MTAFALLLLASGGFLWPRSREARIVANWTDGPELHANRPDAANETPHDTAAVLDIFAACLRAGLVPAVAARAAADALPSSVSAFLRRTSELLELGVDQDTAWSSASNTPETDVFVSVAQRSARAGTPLADAVRELAADIRQAAADAASEKAQRAGVLIAGPLGLCFLPAFMCLGIAPVVIGLVKQLTAGGFP